MCLVKILMTDLWIQPVAQISWSDLFNVSIQPMYNWAFHYHMCEWLIQTLFRQYQSCKSVWKSSAVLSLLPGFLEKMLAFIFFSFHALIVPCSYMHEMCSSVMISFKHRENSEKSCNPIAFIWNFLCFKTSKYHSNHTHIVSVRNKSILKDVYILLAQYRLD